MLKTRGVADLQHAGTVTAGTSDLLGQRPANKANDQGLTKPCQSAPCCVNLFHLVGSARQRRRGRQQRPRSTPRHDVRVFHLRPSLPVCGFSHTPCRPLGTGGKASVWRAADLGSVHAFAVGLFLGRVIPVTEVLVWRLALEGQRWDWLPLCQWSVAG